MTSIYNAPRSCSTHWAALSSSPRSNTTLLGRRSDRRLRGLRENGGADHRHRSHVGIGRGGRAFSMHASSAAALTRKDGRQYDVAAAGRFLINTLLDGAAAPIALS